jgi:hypothetical protein
MTFFPEIQTACFDRHCFASLAMTAVFGYATARVTRFGSETP